MKQLSVVVVVFALLFAVPHVVGQEKNDDRPPYYLTDAELDKKLGVDEKTEAPKEYVWLIYFHRVPGCSTCQLMAKYIYETVDKRFSNELKARQIVLRYKNLDAANNIELVKRFSIRSPMLVAVHIKDGKIVRAKHTDKIWSLAAEKEKFIDYVEKEIKSYFPESEEKQK